MAANTETLVEVDGIGAGAAASIRPSRDRLAEMNAEWSSLKARADQLTGQDIPALNKKLWELGVGAIWKK